ncbi:MAG: ribokinase [Chitinophagaceae bacterium]
MSSPSIIVIGSSNTDMVIKTTHLPLPGETILGGNFYMNAGGKGANQAVAAAKLGGNVTFFARVGNDIFGEQAKVLFRKEGIETAYISTDEKFPSGVALITVDKKGENCIVVAPGANNALSKEDLQLHEAVLEKASLILMQLEIPLSTVEYVSWVATKATIKLILNPAPACALSDELLARVTIITPNEKEAEMLTGIKVIDKKSAQEAARVLNKKGIETVIITLGSKGALLLHENVFSEVNAPVVEAIDTTAAGDVFNGALAVALSEGKPMLDAVLFSCKAAAISVTKLGAQASAPYRNEVDN